MDDKQTPAPAATRAGEALSDRRWIPTTECCPPYDETAKVIAFTRDHDYGGVQFHHMKALDFYEYDPDGGGEPGTELARNVTHWMPEPWPPGDEHLSRAAQPPQAPPAAPSAEQGEAVPVPLSDAQMLLSWMDETFGNDEGDDWQDADAAAVADALGKAIADFKRMRAALATQPAAPVGWVLVPEKVTTDMCAAYWQSIETDQPAIQYDPMVRVQHRWESLLAAAPKTGGANG